MNLLFITRKYPPSVGGMENVSYNLVQELSKQVPTTLIAWGGSQKWLPYFLPKAFFQALWLVPAKRITNIHLGDGLLAPLGLGLKLMTGRKVTATVHGLDITFKNPLYQAVVPRCLARLDRIICISGATMNECIKRGIPAAKCTVIPWGVHPDEFKTNDIRADLEDFTGMKLQDKKVLLTVGRLVKRKGVAWFINEVMPQLEPQYIYLIAGEGPERPIIEEAITAHDLQTRVKLLGKVTDPQKKLLYNTSDVFVMPNTPVEGDMEGFGIVAIEASSTGLPVVASDLEGVRDAVIVGTGRLVSNRDAAQYVDEINQSLKRSKSHVTAATQAAFSWQTVANQYLRYFR